LVEKYNDDQPSSILAIALCTFAFLVCILFTVAPLSRIADPVIHLQTPGGTFLSWFGSWLPNELPLNADHLASQVNTNYIDFLILIALAFVIYGLCALFTLRQASSGRYTKILLLIWIGAIVSGLIYVFAPAMLSHDILVYASYSRVIDVYHANPYFVPLSTYSNDPFIPLNYWSNAIAA
jgi:hypothetical protein